ARSVSDHAIRRGHGAAWIGLDWLDDAEMSQLVVLGPDLYNGNCGIAVFLAAHAAVTGHKTSEELAAAAVARLRETLRGRNPARLARTLGTGGALGMGSVIYGLAVIAALNDDDDILTDAHVAAALITDDVIASDHQLDLLGGSAGAILALLRLYRQAGSAEVLRVAEACARHLLAQDRVGQPGDRTWPAPYFGRPLNGMAHGASGFAYSLASLSSATGKPEYAAAAEECLAFERSTFDIDRRVWADLRNPRTPGAPCKWCYGAPGIGLARVAMTKLAGVPLVSHDGDIDRALVAVDQGWPAPTDTLCCGTLASIEFLVETADVLGRADLRERASHLLLTVLNNAHTAGDYRWSSGTGRFNLGLFRGIAGIGYTMLRRIDGSLPDVLIWE
ncbi:MAG: type 2 lanthipeptide synthetase LanM, partial [Mycobacterium sp.]